MCGTIRSLSGVGGVVVACLWLVAGPQRTALAEDKNITVRAGESFTISLPWTANASWTASLDSEAAKRIEVKNPGPAPGGKPGETKNRDYNFKAIQAGEVTFTVKKREVGSNRLLDSVQVTVKIR